jgi:hypothetical protein
LSCATTFHGGRSMNQLALIILVAAVFYSVGRSQQAWRDMRRGNKRRRPGYVRIPPYDDQLDPRELIR